MNETFKHLKKLKRQKALGIDNLPPGNLRFNIAKPLNHLKGKVPKTFKMSKIKTTFNNRSKNQFDYYHPITVLLTCSKVLERCIHSQLMNHLETHKLLSQDQFGFRSK